MTSDDRHASLGFVDDYVRAPSIAPTDLTPAARGGVWTILLLACTAVQVSGAAAVRLLTRAALWRGWLLFGVNALTGWHVLSARFPWTSLLLRRSAGGTAYWTAAFISVLLLLALALTGTSALPVDERRRVRLFWS